MSKRELKALIADQKEAGTTQHSRRPLTSRNRDSERERLEQENRLMEELRERVQARRLKSWRQISTRGEC